jgi:uncharacterized membrane protein
MEFAMKLVIAGLAAVSLFAALSVPVAASVQDGDRLSGPDSSTSAPAERSSKKKKKKSGGGSSGSSGGGSSS